MSIAGIAGGSSSQRAANHLRCMLPSIQMPRKPDGMHKAPLPYVAVPACCHMTCVCCWMCTFTHHSGCAASAAVQLIKDIRNRTGAKVHLFDEEKGAAERILQVRHQRDQCSCPVLFLCDVIAHLSPSTGICAQGHSCSSAWGCAHILLPAALADTSCAQPP